MLIISRKFVGIHKDDKQWDGIIYDKNGNILREIVNGVTQD